MTEGFKAELGGLLKMAEGLVGKQAAKQFDTDLDALKLLVEAGQV